MMFNANHNVPNFITIVIVNYGKWIKLHNHHNGVGCNYGEVNEDETVG